MYPSRSGWEWVTLVWCSQYKFWRSLFKTVYYWQYSKYRGTLNLDLTTININELHTVDSFGWISGCRMKWSQSEGQSSHFWRCDLSDAPFICKLNGLMKATIFRGHLTRMYRSLTYPARHAYQPTHLALELDLNSSPISIESVWKSAIKSSKCVRYKKHSKTLKFSLISQKLATNICHVLTGC